MWKIRKQERWVKYYEAMGLTEKAHYARIILIMIIQLYTIKKAIRK